MNVRNNHHRESYMFAQRVRHKLAHEPIVERLQEHIAARQGQSERNLCYRLPYALILSADGFRCAWTAGTGISCSHNEPVYGSHLYPKDSAFYAEERVRRHLDDIESNINKEPLYSSGEKCSPSLWVRIQDRIDALWSFITR